VVDKSSFRNSDIVTDADAENEYLQQSANESQNPRDTYWPPVCAALNKIPMLTWIATRARAAAYAGFSRIADAKLSGAIENISYCE
jgi:hypothetical protein